MSHVDRRAALRRLALLGLGPLCLAGGALADALKSLQSLAPGEFTWHPERSPKGPVAVVVSIPEQRVHVYRNGVRIGVATCSTGKEGHRTPTGVFTILEKDKDHRSSIYNNAPMPNMQRLTWDGIALHAGGLPGYPASHGCVRLPMAFSEKLWGVTHVGTPVIIAGSHDDPWELTHPGLVLGEQSESEFEGVVAGLAGKQHPADWGGGAGQPVTTVVASTADRKVELLENGRVVAAGKLKGNANPVGSHVLMLKGADAAAKGMTWQVISHQGYGGAKLMANNADVLDQLATGAAFQRALKAHLHPGMVLIVTELPLHPDRRSGEDFVIMSSS